MDVNRRALYSSLRMNWVLDPTMEVEAWQVEDYRAVPLDGLIENLEDLGISLDKSSFLVYAETVDTPEDLTDFLLHDGPADPRVHDKIYLLIFEMWRRLLPERQCLSIICEELDHQIYLYDKGHTENAESMQDTLANLQVILDDNVDDGADSVSIFEYINSACANDLESFLYDYISDQIDNNNTTYASELLEGFSNYISDHKWFDFLRIRLIAATDTEEANHLIQNLIEDDVEDHDITFNLEMLSFLVRVGEQEVFEDLVKNTLPLLQIEDDFQSLLSICADFYHRLDVEEKEQVLLSILENRKKIDLDHPFVKKDPDFVKFSSILD